MTAHPGARVGPAVAIDIGGTKIHAALVDPPDIDASRGGSETLHEGNTSARGVGAVPRIRGEVLRCPTPASDGPRAVIDAASALAQRALDSHGLERPAAVGVASAGIIDAATGAVAHATDALPGWPGTRLREAVVERFAAPTAVLNDVHAHGLGEALFGVGAGRASMLMVAVGTGVGGAYVRDGAVDTGATGAAGHVGHLAVPEADGLLCSCGRTGHLEALAAGPAIARLYARRTRALPHRTAAQTAALTTREIAQRAADGDELARDCLTLAGRATGRMIGGLLNVLDPAVVAVTGGVAASGPIWWAALRDGVAHDAMDATAATPVLEAAAGEHAALLGAAHAAWNAT